jgi:hypothetical protein
VITWHVSVGVVVCRVRSGHGCVRAEDHRQALPRESLLLATEDLAYVLSQVMQKPKEFRPVVKKKQKLRLVRGMFLRMWHVA